MKALLERDDVLLSREQFSSEPPPDLDAVPSTTRVWLPLVPS